MSNTFNFKRFWNYLVHDIRSASFDSGLTVAIVGAMPVFFYFISEAISLVFTGRINPVPEFGKYATFITAITIVLLFFPAKHYGVLTDKRQGSDWLMLPASRLEKWLSMLVVTCLVLPLFLTAELTATDGLISLIFPGTYGATTVSGIVHSMGKVWGELHTEAGGIAMCWPYALYLSWCENILLFTLGAIWFKKSKIGMTFVSYFVLMMVITMAGVGLMRAIGMTDWNIDMSDITEEGVIRTINIIMYGLYVVWFAVFDVLIYLRVKTLKH